MYYYCLDSMERKIIFNKVELYSFSNKAMNSAYNNQRKISNAASAFGLGTNEELEVSVRPEITEEGQEEWNVDLSVKQYYPTNTLMDLLTPKEK